MNITGGVAYIDGGFEQADVAIDGELFSTSSNDGESLDATGCFVIPGLVDIHFHGCRKADFCDGTTEAFDTISTYEASRGVTAICPATMTYPEQKLTDILSTAAKYAAPANGAALVGINMEGPFISPNRVGAQNPEFVQRADVEMFRRLQAASGNLVKLIDIAPEEPSALEFIEETADEVRISLAHTCADYNTAMDAFAAGARHMTHLFNAMPGLHHRTPGPIAAAADANDVTVEIIADGVHVDPAMVRLTFALFGRNTILISDSMEATGMPDGEYTLGGQAVTVVGNQARLHNGALAGSATDLMGCVRCAVTDMDIPLEQAIYAATMAPAIAIGIDGQRGSIAAGKIADCVVLDQDLNIKHVIVRGRVL